MNLTEHEFSSLVNFSQHETLIADKLEKIYNNHQAGNPWPLIEFFMDYTSWNGHFVGGVAKLVANITLLRDKFMDADQPLTFLADRSNHVASYFFDAARDEYDDSYTPYRDPHRSLAQAFMAALCEGILGENFMIANKESLNIIGQGQPWLQAAHDSTWAGYGGVNTNMHGRDAAFFGMGYHLGSEILADAEFSQIDNFFKNRYPNLREFMERKNVLLTTGADRHRGFSWISIHSGEGNAVEQDHFAWAIAGVEQALQFTPINEREKCLSIVKEGFKKFADDHEKFFMNTVKTIS